MAIVATLLYLQKHQICFCCCSILTDNRMKKEDKIDLFEKIAKEYVDDTDKGYKSLNSL